MATVKLRDIFNAWSLNEKAGVLAEHGNHLMRWDNGGYIVHLYSYNNQFVELWYGKVSRQTLTIEMIDYNGLDSAADHIKLTYYD